MHHVLDITLRGDKSLCFNFLIESRESSISERETRERFRKSNLKMEMRGPNTENPALTASDLKLHVIHYENLHVK